MINILICDDNRQFIEIEKEIIEKAARRYEQEVWVDYYSSGKELIQSLEKREDTKLCILLLDIDMPELGGYDVAKIMNESFPEVLIIFVSNRADLVFQAFEFKPFRFVCKENAEAEVRHALRKAFEIMELRMEKQTMVVSQGEKLLLAHKDILYIILQNRKVCFKLKDGKELEVRGTLKGMLEKLDDPKMIQINSGCVVNGDYIASYTTDTIVMKNGDKLPLSRDRAREVKLQIVSRWRE